MNRIRAHPRLGLVLFTLVVTTASALAFYVTRAESSPPGDWLPKAQMNERRAAYARESLWRKARFVPIEDSQSFETAIDALPMRVETAVEPRDLARLRLLIRENLVARARADVTRYLRQCCKDRPARISTDDAEMIAKRYEMIHEKTLPPELTAEQLFELFWRQEYETDGGTRRPEALAVSEDAALIVVAETRDPGLTMMLTQQEKDRWLTWSGARRLRSTMLHPPPRSLDEVLKSAGKCLFADVVLIVRNRNQDLHCWHSQWFLDPDCGDWQLHNSLAICSRRRYEIPQ